METSLNIIPYILLTFSVSFFVMTLIQRRNLRKSILHKEEAIKIKESEFNEFRLLTAGVTHEINNGLTLIMGRTSLMLKKNEVPEQENALTQILTTSERIATSLVGLRKVIYPDKFEIEEIVELSVLLDDVFKLIGQRLRNHGIELKLRGIEHKVIKGRKSQLEQLIINLINQSIERQSNLPQKWIQIVAVEEKEKMNIYFMDASGGVGDKIDQKQCSDLLEGNHGRLTINQNNLVLELPQANGRFHY